MAKSESTNENIRYDFDDIVVGSGLSGLLICKYLRRADRKVALFEKKEVLGGQYRKQQAQGSLLPSDLGAFVKPENLEALQAVLNQSLENEIAFSDTEIQPKTYENAQFKNFVGFGDQEFQTVDAFSGFNTSNWVTSNRPANEWIEELLTQPEATGQSLHEVTGFEKLTGENGEPAGFKVTVNGGKDYLCKRVFFTPAPSHLLDLITHESMPSKFVTRLAKAQVWTMASLHLSYKPEALRPSSDDSGKAPEFNAPHVYFLMSAKSGFEPCLGRFYRGGENDLYSYWFTLVSAEHAEDNEFLGNSIRHIKKTLKRLFPEVSDAALSEKITISSEAFGDVDLKLKNPLELPDWDGFYLASHLFSSTRGPLAHVDTARQCLEIIGLLEASRATGEAAPEINEESTEA